VKRLNKAEHIEVLPWQTPGLLVRVGLTPEQTMESAWFVDEAGRKFAAAKAINESLAALHWAFKPLAWLYRVPGIKQIEDAVYKWIAANRYRLPGSTAACAVPTKSQETD
jgi:predicted DCC family thiol-disulfide oxidoreductase YuxK